jgi:hypothetical protein
MSDFSYILSNYLPDDIIGAFLEYNQDEDSDYLEKFIDQSTLAEVVDEFIRDCEERGDNVLEVIDDYIEGHYITFGEDD